MTWGRAMSFAVIGALLSCPRGGRESLGVAPALTDSSHLRDAVVEISVDRLTPHHVAMGTGFFISQNGHVLTDWHVIRDAATITVRTAQGNVLKGSVLAQDPAHDLAVLQTAGNGFPFLQLADSDQTEPDLPIILIGTGNSPFQDGRAGQTRIMCGQPMLQISTPLRPGCSGSPLVNEQGQVVGIANGRYAGASPDRNENFAVPVAAIRPLLAKNR
jgi:serine protease Do